MKTLIILDTCGDGTCCCLTPRSSTALISIISLTASIIDVLLNDSDPHCCESRQQLDSMRSTLVTLYQMANMLLLLGSIVENALLIQIYLWYVLGFIVLGFVVSILDFLFRLNDEGIWSFINFVTEVAFLFVTFRCLPLVDSYRKRLEGT
ncbi:uncharacterized protein [Epargyreus clarus]|uniref:uncharacterized protein n=1 Tax=Epargyreus clarus TaxID=520877 RepID=UPI003C2CA07C